MSAALAAAATGAGILSSGLPGAGPPLNPSPCRSSPGLPERFSHHIALEVASLRNLSDANMTKEDRYIPVHQVGLPTVPIPSSLPDHIVPALT